MAGEEAPRVDLASKADSFMLYPHKALVSSASADWDRFYLQYHRQPPYEMVEHSCRQHRIIIHDRTLQSPMIETIEELTQPTQISYGTITVIPANARNWACWNTEHQYVIQCRIERAKKLLLQDELPIAEIAHILGFTHQSHLSRHFKRLVGVTPKAFLKSQ